MHKATFGATMVADGTDDVAGDHIINYAEVTPHGYRALGFQAVTGLSRDNRWISDDLMGVHHESLASAARRRSARMQKLMFEYYESRRKNAVSVYKEQYNSTDGNAKCVDGADHIVQLVTDATSANQKSWVNVEEEEETLMANPCTLHGVSHHFVHALKGDQSATPPLDPIQLYVQLCAESKIIEQVVTNREVPKVLLAKHTLKRLGKKKGCRRHCDIRMGQVYRVLERIKELKRPLKDLVNSEEFDEWKATKVKKAEDKAKIANFVELVESNDFWERLEWMVDALEPVHKLLKMVDGFKPTAGKFYYKCMRIQEHYDNLADTMKEVAAEELRDMWKADWDAMHCVFHSAGYHLDPEYTHLDKDASTWEEFMAVAERLLTHMPHLVAGIGKEYHMYKNKFGIFANSMVWEQAKSMPAHVWWQQWGGRTPAMQYLGMHIPSQTTAASCSEELWSEYGFVINKRRNRMGKERAAKLVRVHCNARLNRRMRKVNYTEQYEEHSDSDSE